MFKTKIVAFLCILSGYVYGAADTTRMLFIGNSLTYTSDVPSLVKGLATASGLPFKCTMYAPPGATVGDTAQGTYAHMFNPEVFDTIRSDNWDFVCVQDNQGRFILGHGRFPDPVAYKIIEGHLKIRDSVKYYHPCAQMVWFAGWVFRDGYPGLSTTGAGLIDNVYQNYIYLKDTAGGIVSPIGIAWERAMAALPGTDLWLSDGIHETLAGAYLTAAVIYTSVFRRNIDVCTFKGGLDSARARTYREIAWQTVIDSSASDNVDALSAQLSVSGATLTATTGYSTYYWYLNGALVSVGSTNTLSAATDGCYQVIAVNSDSCYLRSKELCILSPGMVHAAVGEDIRVYPVPAEDFINVEWPQSMSGVKKITLTDATGRLVAQCSIVGDKAAINISKISGGMYLLGVQTSAGCYHQRVVVK